MALVMRLDWGIDRLSAVLNTLEKEMEMYLMMETKIQFELVKVTISMVRILLLALETSEVINFASPGALPNSPIHNIFSNLLLWSSSNLYLFYLLKI